MAYDTYLCSRERPGADAELGSNDTCGSDAEGQSLTDKDAEQESGGCGCSDSSSKTAKEGTRAILPLDSGQLLLELSYLGSLVVQACFVGVRC